MKRFIRALIVVCLLCSLCACGEVTTPQGEPMEDTTQAVIELVGNLPVGTMGVSLKAIESAVSLMEWCEASTLSAEQVKADVAAYYNGLDEFDRSMFHEQVYLITTTAVEWQDATNMEEDLHMVGLDSKQYQWSEHAFALLDAVGSAVVSE